MDDPEIALVLCHDTKVSLSRAKKEVKSIKNPAMIESIANAYVDLGIILERRGYGDKARAIYEKAERLG